VRENPWLQLQGTRRVLLDVRYARIATKLRSAAKMTRCARLASERQLRGSPRLMARLNYESIDQPGAATIRSRYHCEEMCRDDE
jgi:hypothetical protein